MSFLGTAQHPALSWADASLRLLRTNAHLIIELSILAPVLQSRSGIPAECSTSLWMALVLSCSCPQLGTQFLYFGIWLGCCDNGFQE